MGHCPVENVPQTKRKTRKPTKNIINDIHDECARLVSHLPATKRIDCSSTASEHFLHYRSRPFRPLLPRLLLESHFVSSHFLRVLLACFLGFRDTRLALDTPASAALAFVISARSALIQLIADGVQITWRRKEHLLFLGNICHLRIIVPGAHEQSLSSLSSINFLFVRTYHEPIYKFIHNHQRTFLS